MFFRGMIPFDITAVKGEAVIKESKKETWEKTFHGTSAARVKQREKKKF
jgi:hypothetical protein